MSLSPKNLSSIQRAGQALHDASEAIAATVRTQAESMVASMATAPFSAESEQTIARFKTLSKLSQGLITVEAELQALYAAATDLASAASDVIVLQPVTRRKAIANAAAVDVVAKPAKALKVAKKDKRSGRKPALLTANDNKLLKYLQRALKGGKQKVITGTEMAAGSGLPLGSVGVALKKIQTLGAVNKIGRGTYELGTAIAAPAVETAPKAEVKSAPAKKTSKGNKAQAPVTKDAKAKLAKKTKAPVAKTVKQATVAAAPATEVAAPKVDAEAAPV
jgi:hypothetical protein